MRTNALYCGITTNVERRFTQHQTGVGAKALKGKGPLTLEWHRHLGSSRSYAAKVEYKIKQLSKFTKERIIKGEIELTSVINMD
jgi:putative endonuclease